MRKLVAGAATFASLLLLSGCCPNGCFVLTGDAYRALAFPEPIRERWFKEDITDQRRQTDWFECGGSETGNFSPDSNLLERIQKKFGISDLKAHDMIFRDVQRCMLRKGYRYTGKCDLDVLRAMPACGAP